MNRNTILLADTRRMSRADWLAVRRRGIGGSDAAALVGLNPYATPFSVWADKRGALPEGEETESLRLGRDLEPYVAARFAERSGRRVQRVNAVLGNAQYPFALANIDRRVVGRPRAGLECKTTSAWHVKEFAGGTFPDRYYVQCVHYLAVTGYKRWYVAALVLGQGFYIYQMSRAAGDTAPAWCDGSVWVEDGEIAALMGAEEAFWREHVRTGIPPALDGEEPTTAAVAAVAGVGEREETAPLTCTAALRDYTQITAQIKALEKEKARCSQAVKLALCGARHGAAPGYAVDNVPVCRQNYDLDALRRDHPDLSLDKYRRTTHSSRFTIKEVKET